MNSDNSNAIAAQVLQGRPRDGCTPVNEALRAPTYSKTYFFRWSPSASPAMKP